MSVYDSYKPLRNFLTRFPLLDSLEVMRAYFQFLQIDQPLPKNIQIDSSIFHTNRYENGVYEWELDILTKEIIFNSSKTGDLSLRVWKNFAKANKLIKELENDIYVEYADIMKKDVLLNLYRIAHRQFPQYPKQIKLNFKIKNNFYLNFLL